MPRRLLLALVTTLGAGLGTASTADAVTCANLQTALDAASAGSTVTLDENATCVNMSFTLPNQSITLAGAGSGATFQGDAGAGNRILTGANVGTTVIRNLTFRGGSAPSGAAGGAIDIVGNASPTLDGLQFYGNSSTELSGAVRLQPTTAGPAPVIVRNSTFGTPTNVDGNTGANGGALYVNANAGRPVEVSGSRFVGNSAEGGGAVTLFGPTVTFTSNVVSGNVATRQGGGLSFNAGAAVLTGNTFSQNRVDDPGTADQFGGAIASFGTGTIDQSGNLFLNNSVVGNDASTGDRTGGAEWFQSPDVTMRGDRFIGNTVEVPVGSGEAEGGALSMDGCGADPDDVRLENVVVAGNAFTGSGTGDREGAGIYTGCSLGPVGLTLSNSTISGNDAGGSGTAGLFGAELDRLVMRNSIVAANSGGIDLEGFASRDVASSDACLAGGAVPPGAGNFCASPLLVDAAAGDVHQTATSPTRDKGSNAFVPAGLATDFEGDARIRGPIVDIGADEHAPPPEIAGPPPPPPPGAPPVLVVPRDLLAPVVSAARFARTRFAVATPATPVTGVASQRRRRVPRGTTILYTLSERATVALLVERRVAGRRVGGRCVRTTRRNRSRRACTRLQRRGVLTRTSRAGVNRVAFSGRIGRRVLAPGSYQLTLVATDAARNRSRQRVLRFAISRG